MLKKLLSLGAVLVSAALASCGGGGAGTISGSGGGAAAAAIITVLASSPQLQSDQGGANTVAITAQVKDASNAVLEGVTVQFGASSGSLAVTQAVTDGSGYRLRAVVQRHQCPEPRNYGYSYGRPGVG